MRAIFIRRLTSLAAITVTASALAGTAAQATEQAPRAATASPAYAPPPGVIDPCPSAAPGEAGCAALISAPTGSITATTTPAGFGPADLRSAYQLNSSLGSSETVAVVTAYNDPDAASDLAAYRSQYGIPACTTASGCFKQVSQTGSTTSLPGTSAGWDAPVAESTDVISAICPNCHILLVEASSTAIADLGAAENEAVSLGAEFVDNDWVVPEASLGTEEPSYDTQYFHHPGVAITAPAGDDGYGTISYPAASPYVTAVGGTTLTADSTVSRGYTETAWVGTGSGCSAFEAKPSWQTDSGCADRTLNDVAADADPNSPVAYYDTPTGGGWGKGGGTVVAAAIVAAAYALAGNPAPGSNPASYLYTHPKGLWAVTSGSNGTCTVSYLCTAGPGYNGPAGEGTPFGYAAFHTVGAKPATVVAANGTTWVFVTTASGAIEADSLPSNSSTWSGLTSLGGGPWTGYPTALAAADGSTWVFGLSGGDLYADHLPSGSTTWSGWTDLGNSGVPMVGHGVPAQDKSGDIWIFIRDSAKGNLYSDELPSGSSSWTGLTNNFGGNLPDDIAVVVGSGGWMTLAGVGNDGRLYTGSVPPGGTWTGWTQLAGSAVTGVPDITQDNAGADHLFARQSTDGAMVTSTVPGGSSTWSSLSSIGGTWTNDPITLTGSGGTVWLLAIGLSTDIYLNQLGTSGSWSGWANEGSGFTGVPGLSEYSTSSTNVFHLFGRSQNGNLQANQISGGSSTWAGWASLGGSLAGS